MATYSANFNLSLYQNENGEYEVGAYLDDSKGIDIEIEKTFTNMEEGIETMAADFITELLTQSLTVSQRESAVKAEKQRLLDQEKQKLEAHQAELDAQRAKLKARQAELDSRFAKFQEEMDKVNAEPATPAAKDNWFEELNEMLNDPMFGSLFKTGGLVNMKRVAK